MERCGLVPGTVSVLYHKITGLCIAALTDYPLGRLTHFQRIRAAPYGSELIMALRFFALGKSRSLIKYQSNYEGRSWELYRTGMGPSGFRRRITFCGSTATRFSVA